MNRFLLQISALATLLLFQGCDNATIDNGGNNGSSKKMGRLGSSKWKAVYQNDFSEYAVGENEMEGMIILEGNFSVTDDGGNKRVTLPADPLDDFGILFGPRIPGNLGVGASFLSERKGRRYPTFGVAMGGVNGYRLKLQPSHRKLYLVRAGETVAEVPWQWQSGEVVKLRVQREKNSDAWKIKGKAWHGNSEPKKWDIEHESDAEESAGKSSIWVAPYSTQPIHVDDFKIFSTEPLPES